MSDSTVDVSESGTQDETKSDESKTFTLDYVKALRSEAAGFRSQLRDAEKARDEAQGKLKEVNGQVTELSSKLAPTEALALKYSVALDLGLPKALATRLTGSTEEELKADAESLKSLLGESKSVPDLDQGPRTAVNSSPSVNDALRALWTSE